MTILAQDPSIAAFFVNGTSLGGSDPVHVTPWATLAAAEAAATAYRDQLNTWWHKKHPTFGWYLDPSDPTNVLQDTVHYDANGQSIRYGIMPRWSDLPPAPPTGTVIYPYGSGIDWTLPPG